MFSRISVTPSAHRLTISLRDIGYSFESAVADLIDNSITAGASSVDVTIGYRGKKSYVSISDNGRGMTADELNEALRFGSQRSYGNGDLGRYGLGLKTASLSQCRRLSVYSRDARSGFVDSRCLDIDFIQQVDDWVITDGDDSSDAKEIAHSLLTTASGTVVIWESLDRLLPSGNPESTWAKRKFENLATRLRQHLELVFHRFLSGEGVTPVTIRVNGVSLTAWDPFQRQEPKTKRVSQNLFEIDNGRGAGQVRFTTYCLPARSQFSSAKAFENAAGPRKWNRQQGIYVYRANRLVQWGGWDGIRTLDEHTKLARAALDFGTELDDQFNINVAKMRVSIPTQLRKLVTRAISDVCAEADARYRRDANDRHRQRESENRPQSAVHLVNEEVGLRLKSIAMRSGNYSVLQEIFSQLRKEAPEIADAFGM